MLHSAHTSPTLLVTGSTGQVGSELTRSLAPLGKVHALDRIGCDFSQPAQIREAVESIRPDIIVNAAAYTAVDEAETDVDAAYAINARAPQALAEAAAKSGALLIHYSTDYVFDGQKQEPYVEDDPTNPLSVYGKSKLAGESAITKIHERHLILRASWIFSVWGNNFFTTMLKLAGEQARLRVVADQHGAPTSASLIADVTAHLVAQYLRACGDVRFPYGVYHLAAAGVTTWHQYAQLIVERALTIGLLHEGRAPSIEAILSSQYPRAAPRPENSRLATDRLQTTFGLTLPRWEEGLEQSLRLLAVSQNLMMERSTRS
ncbi:dTDP-4-dehydrorhamnose reductase [Ralstonia mannitolilytica]|uniref:dTDP-4-dehydrorhamnose reductase n=1 Tax=Ralstonia mannitolilytica TaxID=105219 RepID=A0AAJ4ZJC2_9RALS|nr:dTDP-4-dehydrorhamnose reductase [Ralstonia mannitolilytica]CAG2151477.1 dTDP-4-dehydrorhamnose reductase [Ralstonia mannitolilytica]CAJ0731254.1 dTDP-4-dehydrorhamnose reductase [Ralstonia mannitolilytica]SUD86985.1 dTDP-4-dehydrorhamnose reductase [Ralstonia mannitolilytica]SUD92908.1 dTDP-4-dehydrorhamnose reductase [Ralstonia mannitolilytica]SUD96646.1 dTDP-4-dehydrorhamnose reductase [Ralstonia mannitolilytica]